MSSAPRRPPNPGPAATTTAASRPRQPFNAALPIAATAVLFLLALGWNAAREAVTRKLLPRLTTPTSVAASTRTPLTAGAASSSSSSSSARRRSAPPPSPPPLLVGYDAPLSQACRSGAVAWTWRRRAATTGGGAPPRRRVLVVCGGNMFSVAAHGAAVMQALRPAARDADVIAYDRGGVGTAEAARASLAAIDREIVATLASMVRPYASVVVLGHSMGCVTAAALARRLAEGDGGITEPRPRVRAVVLISGFASVSSVARAHVPVPRLAIRAALAVLGLPDLSPARDMGAACAALRGAPIWIVHGEADEVVPPAQARAVAARCPSARLVTVPGARSHGDVDRLVTTASNLLDSVWPPTAAAVSSSPP